ncbi:MerR family transcriptional regulator [Caproiciproducens sp. NJN-50]|uniref:MerR family transcriptional regulator n=1 Tax=Acutalibacteraceae TaxID=3082771 RepID=UPI000FFE0ED2|nr:MULTISPECIES: MerR family transcriptional regulator [Acutalibacteraceae]QAT49374.1 MerR family transcriptional regulator [Caproiciproducens sp. NJN-50]
MEYTIQKLAKLSGISTRTLRYYDETGLLKPARLSPSGYRIYGGAQVGRLQQILFYRELGVGLKEIGKILDSPGFSAAEALRRHRELLLRQRARLDLLIRNVEKTLACEKGESSMTDSEKFEGFKENLVKQNERRYGKEIRKKYGTKAVERSSRKLLGMTQQEYGRFQDIERSLNETLLEAFQTGDPAGETAQKAAALHREWLSFTWETYTPEAHAALAQMYVDDPRFTAYYDRMRPGLAKFLRDTVKIYTDRQKNN